MTFLRTAALAAFLSPATLAQAPCAWQAEGNLVMLEVESIPPAGNWIVQTTYPGFAGDSYYRWNGPNHFTQPGNGTLTYLFEVHEDGHYELRLHNRHEHPDSTLENDCWVRMDGGNWIKLYSNGGGTVAQWTWKSRFEINGNHSDAGWDLAVGRHELQISGRSWGFQIDRINFYKGNPPGNQNVATPVSDCGLGGNFCVSGPNSTGSAAEIEAVGSVSVADNDLLLVARPVPPQQTGIFFYGTGTVSAPFGNGTRCVGGTTFRLPATQSQGTALARQVDLSHPPHPTALIVGGSTWHFQAWFRDPFAGGAAFDLSNGMHINFLP